MVGKFEMLVFQSVIIQIAGEKDVGFAVFFQKSQAIGITRLPILDSVDRRVGFGRLQSIPGKSI